MIKVYLLKKYKGYGIIEKRKSFFILGDPFSSTTKNYKI